MNNLWHIFEHRVLTKVDTCDTFDLRSELSGLQMIMDFDPDVDQLRLDQTVGSYRIDVRGDDLWLMTGERAVAVFEGLVDQHDTLEDLIG